MSSAWNSRPPAVLEHPGAGGTLALVLILLALVVVLGVAL